jgi:hypothetical protein
MHDSFIRLTAVDESAVVGAGGLALVSLAVENASGKPCRCAIRIGGLPAAWYDVEPGEVALEPGESAPSRLTIHAPQSALGRYPFNVTARSEGAVTGVAALGFTLVVGAGGALRVYPGPATMPQQAAAGAAAADAGAVATRSEGLTAGRAAPRLLAFVVPLLLVLLLLGVAVARRSSGTGTGTGTGATNAAVSMAHASKGKGATTAGLLGSIGGAGRASQTRAGMPAPTTTPETLPMIGAVYASETAAAGGTQPSSRQGRRGTSAPAQPTITVTPAALSAPSRRPRSAATAAIGRAGAAAGSAGGAGAAGAAGAAAAQPTVNAAGAQRAATGAVGTQPTAGGAGAQPAATPASPAATRQAVGSVALATGRRASTPPAARPVPTGSSYNATATPVRLVAAVRVVHPAHSVARAGQRRAAPRRAARAIHLISRPAGQRRAAPRGQKARPRQVRPAQARRVTVPHTRQRGRIVTIVARGQGRQRQRHVAPRPVARQRRPQQRPTHRVQQRRAALRRRQVHHAAPRPQQLHHAAQGRPGQAHAPSTAPARTQAALRVAWPARATLHFDRPGVLRLGTEPGAAVVVTLRAMIHVRGVGGREVVQPYHTTLFAVADRYGQVRVPLRFAYVPTRPTPGTLTVVARTARGAVTHSAPITLVRR